MRVSVTDPASGTVGASLVVGHLEVSASPGEKAPTPAPRPSLDPDPSVSPATPKAPSVEPRPSREPSPAKETPVPRSAPVITDAPATAAEPPTPPTPAGPLPRLLPGTPGDGDVTLVPSATGYVFPVAGQFSYSDDYGAPRAVTISHQGNDVFADIGTPVVAVADGTLSQVGVNTLGGNRLWLTDDQGAAYYFAHLSAYAAVALEGARVRAGEVIAYVGNTGQAITTPPHLHFEVHPGGKEAGSIDPYPLLRSWEQNGAAGTQLQTSGLPVLPDAAAGAIVVAVTPTVEEPLPATDGRARSAR
jgi:murein DD-endopeptidase MepM/ murein hydrolase activator NlpD